MRATNGERNIIQILQVLRAVGATVVFFAHFFCENYTFFGVTFIGNVGVGVFFVISGFLLVYSDKGRFDGYLIKRIIRICPLYWIVTLAVFVLGVYAPSLLHTGVSTIPNLIKSLFFVPYYSRNRFWPLLPVGWTLILETFIYLLYYCVAKLLQLVHFLRPTYNPTLNQRGLISMAIILILVVLNKILPKNLFTFVYGDICMLYFAIGIIGSLLFKNFPKVFESFQKKCVLIQKYSITAVIFLFPAFIGFSTVYVRNITNILILGLATLAITAVFWSATFPKAVVFIGDISYSFYLTHYFIVKFCLRVFAKYWMPNNIVSVLVLLVACYAATLFISWISYQLIEKKLAGALKRLFLSESNS